MKVAITICGNRISPVFAIAKRLLVVDFERGREVDRTLYALNDDPPTRRAQLLADLGVDVLICGGVTSGHRELIEAAGIRVVDRAVGTFDQALGSFSDAEFGSKRRRQHGRSVNPA